RPRRQRDRARSRRRSPPALRRSCGIGGDPARRPARVSAGSRGVLREAGVAASRFITIHGHFYQPPRENPWLEAVEVQASAPPSHDWNERVTAECYAPNTAARRLGPDNRIIDVVNNFAKISFNVGPTLLVWLERHAPDTYAKILEADRVSVAAREGHGN